MSAYVNLPLRPLSVAQADLDRDARLNFETLLNASRQAFVAGDYAASESKAKAALNVLRRVISRIDSEAAHDTFSG